MDSISIDFPETPSWSYYEGDLPKLSVINESFQLIKNDGARANATIVNEDLNGVNEIDIYGVIFDEKNNAIAAASTYIETLNSQDKREVTFTWVNDIEEISYICDGTGEVFLFEGSGSSSDNLYTQGDRLREILGDKFKVSVLTKPSKIEWAEIFGNLKKEKEGDNLSFAVLQQGGVLSDSLNVLSIINKEFDSTIPLAISSIDAKVGLEEALLNRGAKFFSVELGFDDVSIRPWSQKLKSVKCKGKPTRIDVLVAPKIWR